MASQEGDYGMQQGEGGQQPLHQDFHTGVPPPGFNDDLSGYPSGTGVPPETKPSSASPSDMPPASVDEPYEVRVVSVKGVGDRRVTVVCLSDTHSCHSDIPVSAVPPGDVLIHCGDFSRKGKEEEVKSFNTFMASLPHRTKLLVGGNHDVGVFCDFVPAKAETMLPSTTYLNNRLVEVEGLRIYGSPWDRRGNRGIPTNVDILMTHDPPEGILDGGHGCEYLRRDIASQRPRLHVFGHIHEACGVVARGDGGEDVAETTFVNAAMANDGMVSKRLDKPIVVINLEP